MIGIQSLLMYVVLFIFIIGGFVMYTFMFYSVSKMEVILIIANSVMHAHYIFGSELVKKFNNGDNDYKIVGSVDHSITNDICTIDSDDLNN